MTVEAGRCCAILGPNGSGKSALLAVLSGYLWPTLGTVCVDGQVYGHVPLGEVRRKIGLIEPSRSPRFDDRMRVRDVVATGLFGTVVLPMYEEIAGSRRRRVDDELHAIGMLPMAERAYGDLSSGEQMKTLLARAMVADASILLLDEPTVGLDIGSRAACVAVLDRLLERPDSPTVVIVSHHLDELPRAVSRVVLLKAGRIVGQGSPEEFLTSAHLSALFDCRVDVLRNDGRYVAGIDPP
jgi:iron complex transport system ATP-binding protein